MIVIIDYGAGNLDSVTKAARSLGRAIRVSDSVSVIAKAKKIVLPGVGHFGEAVKELKKRKLFSLIQDRIGEGVPFLGICVGMQILFKKSSEAPNISGLGLIKGSVKKFIGKDLIVPHMGWNQVEIKDHRPKTIGNRLKTKDLFKGIKNESFFYFAHSYYCDCLEKEAILTTTDYGVKFTSSLNKDNIWAVQFHPEKSQELGLKVFKNFLNI